MVKFIKNFSIGSFLIFVGIFSLIGSSGRYGSSNGNEEKEDAPSVTCTGEKPSDNFSLYEVHALNRDGCSILSGSYYANSEDEAVQCLPGSVGASQLGTYQVTLRCNTIDNDHQIRYTCIDGVYTSRNINSAETCARRDLPGKIGPVGSSCDLVDTTDNYLNNGWHNPSRYDCNAP